MNTDQTKGITVVYHDRLLPYQFKIEHLPGEKKELVDYISHNPYQPAKSISKNDEDFSVATLSRIHTDAKLLQQGKNISAFTLNKFYHDNKFDIRKSSTQHTKQVLNINFAKPKLLMKDNISPAPQSPSSKLPLKRYPNLISDPATLVRLTNNNSALAELLFVIECIIPTCSLLTLLIRIVNTQCKYA